MDEIRIVRLESGRVELAREAFAVMSDAFEESRRPLTTQYVEQLLRQPGFWAMAAVRGERVLGGITAHTLPMTRDESSELFIYDIAVAQAARRQGIGRLLIESLRAAAAESGITVAFVPAEADDEPALEFYRALGGTASEVAFFVFGDDP
jgi:aminoglycoside 3-N-acetyltransferase I